LIALVGSERIGALLRKEKDGISPPKLSFGGFVEFTSIPRLRSWRFFYFQKSPGLALVSQSQNPFAGKLFSCGQN
jgi:hypothetical protein